MKIINMNRAKRALAQSLPGLTGVATGEPPRSIQDDIEALRELARLANGVANTLEGNRQKVPLGTPVYRITGTPPPPGQTPKLKLIKRRDPPPQTVK